MRTWLLGLEARIRKEVGSDILKVQWRWPASRPLVGTFGNGLFEVRTSIDTNIYRVLFMISGSSMVLLHGFMKKTAKAPAKEIEIARRRKREVET